jgi:hypothetical protein
MTSTNAAQSLSNWSVLTSGSFDSNGNFSITTSIGANPQRYYILRMP